MPVHMIVVKPFYTKQAKGVLSSVNLLVSVLRKYLCYVGTTV